MNVKDTPSWNVLAEFIRTRYGTVLEQTVKDAYDELKEQLVSVDEANFVKLQGKARAMQDMLKLFEALRTKGQKQ